VFVRPQLRQLTKDVIFEDQLSEMGKSEGKSLKNSTTNLGGVNHKAEIYRDMVANLEQSYKAMGYL
jgi:hypothetical protein